MTTQEHREAAADMAAACREAFTAGDWDRAEKAAAAVEFHAAAAAATAEVAR